MGQMSLSYCPDTETHTMTDCLTWTTKVVGIIMAVTCHCRYRCSHTHSASIGDMSLLRCGGACGQMNTAVDSLLMRLSAEKRCQTSHAVLELTELGCVDERVDAAVGEDQYHGEVVEPVTDFDEYFCRILQLNSDK